MAKEKGRDTPKAVAQFKSIVFDTKAVAAEPDADGMVFVPAYGSAFDVIDSHDDMVVKGAYVDTLAEWGAKGAPIPSYYNHGIFSGDPHDNIGFLQEAQEDDYGLKLLVALDVSHNEKAAYVHRLIMQKRLRELSIGFMVKSWEYVKKDGATRDWDTYRKLTGIELLEVSFVPVASNRNATVIGKAAALLYGEDAAVDETPDDAPAAKEIDDETATDTAAKLTDIAASLATAAEGLTAVAEALSGGSGEDENTSEDDDESASDDSGKTAGAKSLSMHARASLALTALHGAGME